MAYSAAQKPNLNECTQNIFLTELTTASLMDVKKVVDSQETLNDEHKFTALMKLCVREHDNKKMLNKGKYVSMFDATLNHTQMMRKKFVTIFSCCTLKHQ